MGASRKNLAKFWHCRTCSHEKVGGKKMGRGAWHFSHKFEQHTACLWAEAGKTRVSRGKIPIISLLRADQPTATVWVRRKIYCCCEVRHNPVPYVPKHIHVGIYSYQQDWSEHRNISQAPAPGKKASSYPYRCTFVQKTAGAIPQNKNRGYDSGSLTVAYAM